MISIYLPIVAASLWIAFMLGVGFVQEKEFESRLIIGLIGLMVSFATGFAAAAIF